MFFTSSLKQPAGGASYYARRLSKSGCSNYSESPPIKRFENGKMQKFAHGLPGLKAIGVCMDKWVFLKFKIDCYNI